MPAQSIESNSVRLPRAVLRRSERIQAMIDSQRATPPADPTAPTQEEPASPAAPIAQPTAPTPTQTQADPDAAASNSLPAGDPRESDPAYWKQRFSVVYGMLRSERQERSTVEAELRGQIRELREQLQTKGSNEPQSNLAAEVAAMFSEEQRQQYGDEQLQAIVGPILAKVRKEAQEAITATVQPLKEEREESAKAELKRKWQAFVDKLVEEVPDALEIDKTPEWLEWLETFDEATGYTHRQMLKAHEGRFDAPKVARLFKKYKAQMGVVTAPPPPTDEVPAPPAPRPPVSPSARGGSGGGDLPPPSPALRPLTKEEIREGFKQAKLGKMSKEARAIFDARLALSQ
jgi:hypothetical protein